MRPGRSRDRPAVSIPRTARGGRSRSALGGQRADAPVAERCRSPPYRAAVPGTPGLDADQQAVLALPAGASAVVLGAPGTGRTTTAVALVADRIARGLLAADEVLLLAPRRTQATRLRDRLLLAVGRPVSAPLARTAASLAFDIARRDAADDGRDTPVLLSGGEQDRLIAQLLPDAETVWPERLGPEVRETRAFRGELRELFARCTERDVDPRRSPTSGSSCTGRSGARPPSSGASTSRCCPPSSRTRSTRRSSSPSRPPRCCATGRVRSPGGCASSSSTTCRTSASRRSACSPRSPPAGARSSRSATRTSPPTRSAAASPTCSAGSSSGSASRRPLRLRARHRAPPPRDRAAVRREGHGAHRHRARRHAAHRDRAARRRARAVGRGGRPRRARRPDRAPAPRAAPRARRAVRRPGRRRPVGRARRAARPRARDRRRARRHRRQRGGRRGARAARPGRGRRRRARAAPAHARDRRRRSSPGRSAASTGSRCAASGSRCASRSWRAGAPAAPASCSSTRSPRPTGSPRSTPRSCAAPRGSRRRCGRSASSTRRARRRRTCSGTSGTRAGSRRSGASGRSAPGSSRRRRTATWTTSSRCSRPRRGPRSAGRPIPAAGFLSARLEADVADDSLAPRGLRDGVLVTTPVGVAGLEFDTVVIAGLQDGVWPNLRPRGSLLGLGELVAELDGRGAPASPVDERRAVLSDELRLFALAASRARSVLLLAAVANDDEAPSVLLGLADGPAPDGSASAPNALRPLVGLLRRSAVSGHARRARGGRVGARPARPGGGPRCRAGRAGGGSRRPPPTSRWCPIRSSPCGSRRRSWSASRSPRSTGSSNASPAGSRCSRARSARCCTGCSRPRRRRTRPRCSPRSRGGGASSTSRRTGSRRASGGSPTGWSARSRGTSRTSRRTAPSCSAARPRSSSRSGARSPPARSIASSATAAAGSG